MGDVVITEEHIAQAESTGITVGQLLDIEPMSPTREEEIKRKYVRGQPLVEPDEVKKLPTRMYELHQWYMEITKTTNRESLMVKVKEEYYFHKLALTVDYSELFQLFHQDALDKALVSCYCLYVIFFFNLSLKLAVVLIDRSLPVIILTIFFSVVYYVG